MQWTVDDHWVVVRITHSLARSWRSLSANSTEPNRWLIICAPWDGGCRMGRRLFRTTSHYPAQSTPSFGVSLAHSDRRRCVSGCMRVLTCIDVHCCCVLFVRLLFFRHCQLTIDRSPTHDRRLVRAYPTSPPVYPNTPGWVMHAYWAMLME